MTTAVKDVAGQTAVPSTNTALVATIFQTSLDNLLLEATRHNVMTPLRDAVQSTRIRGLCAEDVFHTFVLACDTLHGYRQCRQLLLHTLSDLGKMASLRMLPLTGTVVHVICHLMRKLLGCANMNVSGGGGGGRSITQHKPCGTESCVNSLSHDEAPPVDTEFYNASLSSVYDTSVDTQKQQQLVVSVDDELRLRILQTLMAYLSACELHNPALADIMSLLFIMYIQATPGSIVEASCAATIEQRTLALLRGFRKSGDVGRTEEDDSTSLTAQIQSVAYVKDICSICSSVAPKWLKLTWRPSSLPSTPEPNRHAAHMLVIPRRLRILLLRTLIMDFVGNPPITSSHGINIFFAQCLNEDMVLLLLGCPHNPGGCSFQQQQQQQQQQRDVENIADVIPFYDECQMVEEDWEEFFLTQQLAVTVMVRAPQVMRHTMPTLLRHHVMFVKLCNEGNGGEDDTRRTAVVLSLWRKAIADHEVLSQVMLIPFTPSGDPLLAMGATQHLLKEEDEDKQQQQQQQQQGVRVPKDSDGNDFGSTEAAVYDESTVLHPFADLVASAAQLLTNIIITADGTLNLDCSLTNKKKKNVNLRQVAATAQKHRQQSQDVFNSSLPERSVTGVNIELQHSVVGQVGDVLAFLTMFTQSIARVAEVSLQEGNIVTQRAVKNFFIFLHAPLLRCFALAGQYLDGGDVIHTFLKGTTHLVQACCHLGLPACRDAYLHIFVSRIQMHPKQEDAKWTEEVAAMLPRATKTSTETVTALGFGRAAFGKESYQQVVSADATVFLRHSLNELQQKLYVLNCVISVASSMGYLLEEGWQPVASCLLLAEPLLQDIQLVVEQSMRNADDEVAMRDVLKHADHVRDALHLHFINSALASDTTTLEIFLTHFVSEACCQSLQLNSIMSLRMVSECCSLVMLTVTEHGDVPLERVRKLWDIINPFFLYVFSPAAIPQLVNTCSAGETPISSWMGALATLMERIVEDIAVVMAQFCRRLNMKKAESDYDNSNSSDKASVSGGWDARKKAPAFWLSTGMYASVSLVMRFAHLAPSLTRALPEGAARANRPARNTSSVTNEDEAIRQQLLSSSAEMLFTIYENIQIQQQEENTPEALRELMGSVSLVLLKEVLKLVQGFGEELRGAVWEHLLCLLRRTAVSLVSESLPTSVPLMRMLLIQSPSPTTTTRLPETPFSTAVMVAHAKQGISIAFRALETIQHSCITSLDNEGLRQLIRCGGAFMTHSLPGTEQRLNINLSAVQLLWSIADYVVSQKQDDDRNDDLLWCTLLMQLYNGCLDVRPEVRQSALKTIFSLLQTYGGRLSAECWRCVLHSVLTPLMELTLEAVSSSAFEVIDPIQSDTPCPSYRHQSTSEKMEAKKEKTSISSASSPSSTSSPFFSPSLMSGLFGATIQPLQRYEGEQRWEMEKLLAHFGEHPAFFDVMRVTIIDAVCRVFVSHHHVMHETLSAQTTDVQQRHDCANLVHNTLCLFISVCASSRTVARTTSGEAAALSAVRALHALMVAADAALLTESETKMAWLAVERLLRRDDDCFYTESKQCTAAVVADIVASLGDVVAMQYAKSTPSQLLWQKQSQQKSIVRNSSFYNQLCQVLSTSTAGIGGGSVDGGKNTLCVDYFQRYIRLVELCLHSHAVTGSYFFPGRVQVTVIEVWKTLWPSLSLQERGAIIDIVLRQFPSRHMVQAFVTQALTPISVGGNHVKEDGTSGTTASTAMGSLHHQPLKQQQQRFVPLHESLPPGAHPNFLLALLDFLEFVVSDGALVKRKKEQQEDEFASQVAVAVVRVAGALLLLEYAPPEVFATPGPWTAFHATAEFFDKVEKYVQLFLADFLWGMPYIASGDPHWKYAAATRMTDGAPVEPCTNCHEGLLSFATAFTSLVSISSTMLNAMETQLQESSADENLPGYLQNALKRLERFLLLIDELIPHVIGCSRDVAPAKELLSALVPSSSVESPFFAGVAKRALDLLRRWSVESTHSLLSVTTSPARGNVPLEEQKQDVYGGNAETIVDVVVSAQSPDSAKLSRKLQDIARTSMGSRNQAVLRRFLVNPDNPKVRQMAKMTLKTIVLLHSPALDGNKEKQVVGEEQHVDGEDDNKDVKLLQSTLLDLARLVEYTGDDAELRSLVSQAMLGIGAALGFSPLT